MATVIDKKKMFGLLHEMDGTPVRRQVRVLKVGIGLPKGPAVHVWIDGSGQWAIQSGVKNGPVVRFPIEQQLIAQKKYLELRKASEDRKYPSKIPYFTFLRMGIDGTFTHDFEAIRLHGSMPTEIDVIFLSDDPQESAYQWFTAAEMKCEGNGMDARRRLDLAKSPEEKELAAKASAEGEKFFPIIGGCYAKGCMYARGDKPVCKPHSRLYFQMADSPRVGGTCTFDTTGFRSTQQIFSCIREIKAVTGRGIAENGWISGIRMKMVLRPYKVSHNGAPSTQYGVSLEVRASNAVDLMRVLHIESHQFRAAAQIEEPLQIEAPVETEYIESFVPEQTSDDPDTDAAAMEAEFYTDGDPEEEDGEFHEEGDEPAHVQREPIQEPQVRQGTKADTPKADKVRTGWLDKFAAMESNLGKDEFYRRLGAGPESYGDLDEVMTNKMPATFARMQNP